MNKGGVTINHWKLWQDQKGTRETMFYQGTNGWMEFAPSPQLLAVMDLIKPLAGSHCRTLRLSREEFESLGFKEI